MNRTDRLFRAIHVLTAVAAQDARAAMLSDFRHVAEQVAASQPRLKNLAYEMNRMCDTMAGQLANSRATMSVPTVANAEREVEEALRRGWLGRALWPPRSEEASAE